MKENIIEVLFLRAREPEREKRALSGLMKNSPHLDTLAQQ
jgi:hypothetical protein